MFAYVCGTIFVEAFNRLRKRVLFSLYTSFTGIENVVCSFIRRKDKHGTIKRILMKGSSLGKLMDRNFIIKTNNMLTSITKNNQ